MISVKKNNPLFGSKVISILEYVLSVIILIIPVLMFFPFGLKVILAFIPAVPFPFLINWLIFIKLGISVLFGVSYSLILSVILDLVVFVPLALLFFFIGRGLSRHRKWSKIFAMVFGLISFVLSIVYLVNGKWLAIISLVLSGFIVMCLLFSKKIKK